MTIPKLKIALTSFGVVVFAGCATLTDDHGFGEVAKAVQERSGVEARWTHDEASRGKVETEVSALLAQPLDMQNAVRVAMLNNPGLQASYEELGIAEADLVQASRLHNPGLSYKRLTSKGDSGTSIERAVSFDFLGLLTMPIASKIEKRRFSQTKLRVADEILRVSTEARTAFINALAAQEAARYLIQARDAAAAGSELADRMARAGNVSQLDLLREKVFYGEVSTESARAQQHALSGREHLVRVLGLTTGDQIKLGEGMPPLPEKFEGIPGIEDLALKRRFDLQAGKKEIEALASSLGLTKATRFVNVLELGYLNNTDSGNPDQTGYEIRFELPIFDWGGARVAKAEAIYMQAFNKLAEAAVRARSEVREAYANYRNRYDLARYYRDEVVPIRRKISEEHLFRYNGMLIGPFDLLIDARDQIKTEILYIEAVRDFWIADAELSRAVGGRASMENSVPASEKKN